MKRRRLILFVIAGLFIVLVVYGAALVRRGFSAVDEPSAFEKVLARAARRLAVPSNAVKQVNPLRISPDNLTAGANIFQARCAGCHGADGSGQTKIGRNLYPKPPNLREAPTQNLTDGEIYYVIQNGVRLTGMPAWGNPNEQQGDDIWKLVLFIRSLQKPLPTGTQPAQNLPAANAHYTGSAACKTCHEEIYDRWVSTPMANVVRDPRQHPDAILSDISTNPIAKFTVDQVALVYGSIWKQRYFTKVGDDYFPEPVQWDITHQRWLPYFVPTNGDWWAPFYPPDNMKRPTGPTCDGCHSVGYDIQTKQVTEWNVGCERCHGPGSEHVAHPTRDNIYNPALLDYVSANDTCIQCHSQGRPLKIPLEGKYYDWPVGYQVGLRLQDFWQLEEHTLGETTFTHFPDGTAHKNRMQGNDFVQSVMYRRGITCFSCHDVHGTTNYAQLRKPASQLCLDCHAPMSQNGPRTATIEEHTHHKPGTPGSECVDCHMPKVETTLGDVKVRAHTFKFITPAMTEKYKIPNACNLCHLDKTTEWATEKLLHWNERSPWRVQ